MTEDMSCWLACESANGNQLILPVALGRKPFFFGGYLGKESTKQESGASDHDCKPGAKLGCC